MATRLQPRQRVAARASMKNEAAALGAANAAPKCHTLNKNHANRSTRLQGNEAPFQWHSKSHATVSASNQPGGNGGAAGRWSTASRPHSPSWASSPSPPGYRGARSRRGLGVRCYLPTRGPTEPPPLHSQHQRKTWRQPCEPRLQPLNSHTCSASKKAAQSLNPRTRSYRKQARAKIAT